MKKLPQIVFNTPIVILSTIDEKGYPSTRAMLNLMDFSSYPQIKALSEKEENEGRIFLTTNTSSKKIKHIKHNDKACLYFYNATDFKGVTLCGTIKIVEDKILKTAAWGADWQEYYPDGVDSEDYALLLFTPEYGEKYENYSVEAV